MAWVFLVLAGLMEVSGVIMINEWQRRKAWWAAAGMAIGGALSIGLLGLALRQIPMGTGYDRPSFSVVAHLRHNRYD